MMLHSLKLGRSLIAAAAIFWGAALGTPANALLIDPEGTTQPPNQNFVTVTATGSFVGLVAGSGDLFLLGTFDPNNATGFAFQGGNTTEEASFFTTACNCGTTFTATGKDDFSASSYLIESEFFSIKQDGWIAFFHNTSGGDITITTFDGNCGTSCGEEDLLQVSHVTSYVPFPAVGAGLPGLVLACGGLLALARRRRQQIA